MANDPAFPLRETHHSDRGSVRGTSYPGTARGGRYGEEYSVPILSGKKYGECAEGSYFFATNPTDATEITGHAANTAYDAAKSTLLVWNGNSVASGIEVIMDFIKLSQVTPGTNGTDVRFAIVVDNINRYSSAGSTITPVNCNMNSGVASSAIVYAGAVVSTAASASARKLSHGMIRPVISVLEDVYRFDFGAPQGVGGLITSGTTIAHLVIPVAPVILGPQMSMCFHRFSSAQSVAETFEFEVGFVER